MTAGGSPDDTWRAGEPRREEPSPDRLIGEESAEVRVELPGVNGVRYSEGTVIEREEPAVRIGIGNPKRGNGET